MAVDRFVGHLESIDLRKRERIMAWTKGSPEGDFCFGTTRDPKQKGPSRLSRLLANACSRNRFSRELVQRDPAMFHRAGPRLIEVQADEIFPRLTTFDRRSGRSINSVSGGGSSGSGPDLGRQVSAAQRASRTWHGADSADPSQRFSGSLGLALRAGYLRCTARPRSTARTNPPSVSLCTAFPLGTIALAAR